LNSNEDKRVRFIEANIPIVEVPQEIFILPLLQDDPSGLLEEVNRKTGGLLDQLKTSQEWTGKKGQSISIISPSGFQSGRLILLGLGKRESFSPSVFRCVVEPVLRNLRKLADAELAIYCDRELDQPGSNAVEWAVISFIAAGYSAGHYKSEEEYDRIAERLTLIHPGKPVGPKAISRAEILGEANSLARRLAFEPGNILNPTEFARRTEQISAESGLKCEVLRQDDLEILGMNALLAVARGSREPAYLAVLHHRCSDPRPPLLLVGKGVTFDAGGISLKPSQAMEEMKGDKSGAAAVVGAMTAIARLQVPRNITAVLPLVENLPGGSAQRPGDVVRTFSGKTVEIINTDAEGRLILADAIAWARERFTPAFIADIATLTGACVVALGYVRAGYFSNHPGLAEDLEEAGRKSGEKIWRLPLDDEYHEELTSDIADIKNLGGKWGGAITAAKFLEEFTGETPWCHIDMAGLDFFQNSKKPVGATGFGAMLLTCLAEKLAAREE